MQRQRLKQLLEQLEEVLAELKVEVYSDVDKYRDDETSRGLGDVYKRQP